MRHATIFHFICAEFKKAQIPVLLVGGYAVTYYKVMRENSDVDFLIRKGDYEKVFEILKRADYREAKRSDLHARLTGSDKFVLDLDFYLVDDATFAALYDSGKEIRLAGNAIVVPALFHLIAMKLHSGQTGSQDDRLRREIADIIQLIKTNHIDVRSKEFEDLCFKYTTREIYGRILDGVRRR